VLVAVAIGSIIFGFAFGRFLVFFGAGLLLVSAGILLFEIRGQRRTGRETGARRETVSR
jgi:hypothetical protein